MLLLRLIRESILMAWNALVVNRLRTFLSLLGITIGIFAIIAVFTAVDGLEKSVRSSVESLGKNVIYIQKWPWAFGGDYPWWKYWQRPVPTYQEMEMLKDRSSLAEGFAFIAGLNSQTFKYGNNTIENADINLVSHDYADIVSFELESGRYFSEAESNGGYPVAVIGYDIKEAFFPNQDPLEREINVRGRKVHVIGVFSKQGESIIGNSDDNAVMLPVNFARKFLDVKNERLNPLIMAKAKEGVSNAELMDELKGNMRAIRRIRPVEEDNFALNEAKLLSAQVGNLFGIITLAGWVIGGFSILVGGFGIANIMFVSVKERTPIIGIQKSLGAKNYFILIQFLSESVVLCLFGGILGIVLVYFATLIASQSGFDMPLTSGNITLGLSVSVIIGIVSGFVPAFTASRLDPVEAIRAN